MNPVVEETERLIIWTKEDNGLMEYAIYDKETLGLSCGRMNSESVKETIEIEKRIRK